MEINNKPRTICKILRASVQLRFMKTRAVISNRAQNQVIELIWPGCRFLDTLSGRFYPDFSSLEYLRLSILPRPERS